MWKFGSVGIIWFSVNCLGRLMWIMLCGDVLVFLNSVLVLLRLVSNCM